ncbi:hypothetical protein GCM10023067_49740 [Aminobacter aganoensis]
MRSAGIGNKNTRISQLRAASGERRIGTIATIANRIDHSTITYPTAQASLIRGITRLSYTAFGWSFQPCPSALLPWRRSGWSTGAGEAQLGLRIAVWRAKRRD